MGTGGGRILGVDLGLKRTGLALSDELRITTRALETMTPRSRAQDVAHLVALCAEYEVTDVVVGYPAMPQSGDEGGMARRARGFSEALRQSLSDLRVAVHLVDEVRSSTQAMERLVTSGLRRSRRKAALDTEAARILIERWIDEGSPSGPPAE